ncbi:type IV pilin protein [Marinagarivorans algicola]|uniref:type IV pilin protein n=1 Tax=Marinagarivorans algicola TaxID=1513270 RepID=UPI0006B5A26A|nr:type IV pilin protein [Marinagarivorans algicola]
MISKRHYGFNLIELLIAITVVGIVATIAFPSYQNSVRKGNRTDGHKALLEALSGMEQYFYSENTYTTDLTKLGYSSTTNVTTEQGHYTLSVASPTKHCPITSCVTLQAKAIHNQMPDGDLTIDTRGQKLPLDKW